MDIINRDAPGAAEYREKLLGHNVIIGAPTEYWDLAMILSSPSIPYKDWEHLPIHDRAKIKAHHALKNMAELISEHQRNMKQARKEAEQKLAAGAKKK